MKTLEPIKGIEIIDLSLYIKGQNILIISDLHIGYEEALTKQGILVPKFHFKDLVKRLEKLFDFIKDTGRKVDLIIINGDLKHEFGFISDEEWRNTLKCIDFLSRKSKDIILVQGNHDKILGPIADKRKVRLVSEFIVGDIMICHGDKIPDIPSPIKTIIIGHEHPAITLQDGIRSETFKTFVVGKYNKKNLIVQPSFNQFVEGTDMLEESVLSPFLKQDLGKFEVYIVADTVYPFGKLSKLEKLNNR